MAKEKEPEHKIITFDKCPVCGCKERYCEEIAKKEKALGHMNPKMEFCFKVRRGLCADSTMLAKLPAGTKLPAYTILQDICTNCGNIYAVKIDLTEIEKAPDIVVPGQKPFGGFPFPGSTHPLDN